MGVCPDADGSSGRGPCVVGAACSDAGHDASAGDTRASGTGSTSAAGVSRSAVHGASAAISSPFIFNYHHDQNHSFLARSPDFRQWLCS